VLSVAGFLVIKHLFPLGRAVILRVRKASFLREDPLPVDVPNKPHIVGP